MSSINDIDKENRVPVKRAADGPELPPPDEFSQHLMNRLRALIRDEIMAAGGHISFSRYMELALYAPGLGYYSAGRQKFGAAGDFLTAPEISPLFSRCLARQCAQLIRALGQADILEFGAGSGIMAADLLSELAQLDCLPERYLILETSADLRDRQQVLLEQRLPHCMGRIRWLEHLPEPGFRGIVLANEVLDAMPVHRLVMTADGLQEVGVTWRDEAFALCSADIRLPHLARRAEALLQMTAPFPYEAGSLFEVNLAAEDWIRSLAAFMACGLALIVDYGYPRREYYHPERSAGTLSCFYHHRHHDDALILTGLQDITAHIDFTAMAEAAEAAGMTVAGFSSQANFLQDCGLAEMVQFSDGDSLQQRLALAGAIKKLMLPGEMGEVFKVLALTQGLDIPLLGFSSRQYAL